LTAKTDFPAGLLESLRRFDANARWAHANHKKLRKYVNRCLAVDGGRIVGVANDIGALHRRFARRKEVYITFVWPEGLAWVL